MLLLLRVHRPAAIRRCSGVYYFLLVVSSNAISFSNHLLSPSPSRKHISLAGQLPSLSLSRRRRRRRQPNYLRGRRRPKNPAHIWAADGAFFSAPADGRRTRRRGCFIPCKSRAIDGNWGRSARGSSLGLGPMIHRL